MISISACHVEDPDSIPGHHTLGMASKGFIIRRGTFDLLIGNRGGVDQIVPFLSLGWRSKPVRQHDSEPALVFTGQFPLIYRRWQFMPAWLSAGSK